MKVFLLAVVIIGCSANVFSEECDCSKCDCLTFPFKPESCFKHCVQHWAMKPSIGIDSIKNIRPGSSVSLRVLSNSRNRPIVDFSTISNSEELDSAALKTLRKQDADNFK